MNLSLTFYDTTLQNIYIYIYDFFLHLYGANDFGI